MILTSSEAAQRNISPCHGYDTNGYTIGDRVEIHPGTDLWMRGVRYGTVVGLSITPNDRVHVQMDKAGKVSGSENTFRSLA